MNTDHIYWLFSSAAQSISAFIALLLTGYALVHSQMETAFVKDDTLEDIHPSLRKKYHSQLKFLAWITGFAIILSLIAVYINGFSFPYMLWLIILTSLLDFATIVVGIFFVISIIDPQKYEKQAKKIFMQKRVDFKLAGKSDPAENFFKEFIELERLARQFTWDKIIPPEQKMDHFGWGTIPAALSFRNIIDILEKNDTIPPELFKELKLLNRFRNLAFHAHFTSVDHSMVERVIAARTLIENLEL